MNRVVVTNSLVNIDVFAVDNANGSTDQYEIKMSTEHRERQSYTAEYPELSVLPIPRKQKTAKNLSLSYNDHKLLHYKQQTFTTQKIFTPESYIITIHTIGLWFPKFMLKHVPFYLCFF